MSIFKKVFESRNTGEVPDYFERVDTPEDVRDAAENTLAPADMPPMADPFETAPFVDEAAPLNEAHATPQDAPSMAAMAAEAAEAVEKMQLSQMAPAPDEPQPSRPQQPTQYQPAAPEAPVSSVPRMLGTVEVEPTTPAHPATPPLDRSGGASAPRTRLLGFHRSGTTAPDPFDGIGHKADFVETLFPAGWVAVIDGPGEGNAVPVFSRVCVIGRGADQDIRLDFGDTSISRDKHAAIAFDDEQNKFYLGHGGKSNMIRLNGRPVLSTEELSHGDTIRIGETTLRFVALCGADFTWNRPPNDIQ